jgi:hypothetical protein
MKKLTPAPDVLLGRVEVEPGSGFDRRDCSGSVRHFPVNSFTLCPDSEANVINILIA